MWEQGYPRLSGRPEVRRAIAAKTLSSFARLDSRRRLSPRGLLNLSALLVLVETSENFLLGDQPILVFVARGVSPLLVKFVCATANFQFQVGRWRSFLGFSGIDGRRGGDLLFAGASVTRGFYAGHDRILLKKLDQSSACAEPMNAPQTRGTNREGSYIDCGG